MITTKSINSGNESQNSVLVFRPEQILEKTKDRKKKRALEVVPFKELRSDETDDDKSTIITFNMIFVWKWGGVPII